MSDIFIYTILSVFGISFLSLSGIILFFRQIGQSRRVIKALVSLACGVLLGDVFLHLIPEMSEAGFTSQQGLWIVIGIFVAFILERLILIHHSHTDHDEGAHSLAWLSLWGDAVHNFLDGVVIATAYMVSFEVGLATTIAVAFHEIPHEIGDFAILLHGGWSKKRALLANFAVALTAVLGALFALFLFNLIPSVGNVLLPIAAASFIYLSLSDLIPELHKEKSIKALTSHLFLSGLGVVLMYILLLVE